MKFTNSDSEPQSESAEFHRRVEIRDEESRSESGRVFLYQEDEKTRQENRMEENLNHGDNGEKEFSSEHRLKRRLAFSQNRSYLTGQTTMLKESYEHSWRVVVRFPQLQERSGPNQRE